MTDIGIILALSYIGFLAYVGVKGGQASLTAHFFFLVFLLVVVGIGLEVWNALRYL